MGRISRAIVGIILLATAAITAFSDVANLSFIGSFLAVLLLVYFFYKASRGLPKKRFKGGNLADFTSRRAKRVILTSYDRAAFLGGSFILHLARELMEDPMVLRVLKGLDVSRDEFISKLESYMHDEKDVKETNIWRQAKVEEVAIAAFVAQSEDKKPVQPLHLFLALPRTDNERVQRLFNLFGLDSVKLDKASRYYAVINT